MTHATAFWGTIEGFFGRAWSWTARADHIRFLARMGGGLYIYAPKADRALRQDWRTPWDDATVQQLLALRALARTLGVRFGIGLCPFDLFGRINVKDAADLGVKLSQINALQVDVLAVLYDDTRGGALDLADGQVQVFDAIAAQSNAVRFAFCPAYYSDDPVLDQVFGPRPAGYLERLGRVLDATVDLFWTGPRVISSHYPRAHLLDVAERMGRKPLIWDNWPVNDSRALSPFLRLGPPHSRGGDLRDHVAGLICNPMNQAYLSQLPLSALAATWGDQDAGSAWDDALGQVVPPALGKLLRRDRWLVQDVGYPGLTAPVKAVLIQDYRRHADHPAAREMLDFLAGSYVFDPACLT